MSGSKTQRTQPLHNPRASPQDRADGEPPAAGGPKDSRSCWPTLQQVGCPSARMEESPGDQVDQLLCPPPNRLNKGGDVVRALGNPAYNHNIPSLGKRSLDASQNLFLLNHALKSQSQTSPAFWFWFLQLSGIPEQAESGMKSTSTGSPEICSPSPTSLLPNFLTCDLLAKDVNPAQAGCRSLP